MTNVVCSSIIVVFGTSGGSDANRTSFFGNFDFRIGIPTQKTMGGATLPIKIAFLWGKKSIYITLAQLQSWK